MKPDMRDVRSALAIAAPAKKNVLHYSDKRKNGQRIKLFDSLTKRQKTILEALLEARFPDYDWKLYDWKWDSWWGRGKTVTCIYFSKA